MSRDPGNEALRAGAVQPAVIAVVNAARHVLLNPSMLTLLVLVAAHAALLAGGIAVVLAASPRDSRADHDGLGAIGSGPYSHA